MCGNVVIWITVLLLVLWRKTHNTITQASISSYLGKRLDCIRFYEVSGISTTRLMGVISAMVEKELETVTWRRKGLLSAIVSRDSPPEPHCPLPRVVSCRSQRAAVQQGSGGGQRGSGGGQPGSGGRQPPIMGNNPFLLHFAVQSVLNIDVEVPEASENPTQSFEIHNIIRRRKQLLTG